MAISTEGLSRMTATELTDSEVRVEFRAPWELADHELFIRTKALPELLIDYRWEDDSYTLRAPARFARVLGLATQAPAVRELPLAGHLFDYQRWIVEMALKARRFAIWSDCGTGKTPMQLEWARQVMACTDGRVLIIAPLAVCRQTIEESAKFYPDGSVTPELLNSREALQRFCKEPGQGLGITNFEKFTPGVLNELRWLAGLVLDESSILKGGGGVIKWNLIKSAKGIEYKLSCTATPAPNDTMEYASQASFLEKLRNEGEILWTFFHRDPKTQEWKVKPHAREAFYRFMSSWSIYLRKPAAYGFADPFADVPEPEIIEVKIEPTHEQSLEAQRFHRSYDPHSLLPQDRLGVTQRAKLSQLAKGFLYEDGKRVRRVASDKPIWVGATIREQLSAGHQCLVWTVFDEESRILEDALGSTRGVAALHGSMKEADRVATLDRFRRGEVRCLISKAALLGYGLNFQFCTRMIFSGFDDSFERFYQAVRRCYRYGSTEQLKVFVPYIPSLENHVWENVLRKKRDWERDTAEQERRYREALSHHE